MLKRVSGKITEFERVVIETTGLADPAPILHTLMVDPLVATRFRLDSVVTTVDAVNGDINAVIETYPDPVPVSPEPASDAPFAGVPFLIKDVGLHFGGLKPRRIHE